ncbi:chromate efflux transporter [Actimicrobium sp. CCI2.3]|uniref:chromate efflux transporter n=1 Tax=Actimicrobium sp. CCI2.3 TaxID=3048616 RepID=UPI002AB5772C|nr:chromate efflux transporter [Actimicrobium sp. CCI2.3]MDY7574333.1 chromate efflux transporter [Actimicrobium sp. CCI2.3]MEB0023493.1 chromate efflux transporter [Actimicrobium sp. CCI2.3]
MTTPDPATTAPPADVSLREAFWYWLKLGFISFGGPAGQIALMHADLVEKRRWISERRFLHALNFCMLLPGPEATQLAVYIGWLMHRTRGGIMAGALFVLPSLFILIALGWIYLIYGNQPVVAGILYGIKPAVVAIVLAAAFRIGSRTLKNNWLRGIAVLAFAAITLLHLPFPLIVLVAGLLGWIGGRVRPELFRVGGSHAAAATTYGPALIDDATPTPSHAHFSPARLALTGGVGIGLAIFTWAAIALLAGIDSTLAQLGWFFTKAAMLTFGGAYAVLPYVYQGAVEHYQWLTAVQMIDGLALGETTPGPLIMIVAFVGFVGGWTKELFGAQHLLVAGVIGAFVATWFTFLPSFIFILAGGPLVESTRDNIRLTAPLTAISAAVVGVIISLAVFFADHVFRLQEGLARWDWIAIAIMLAACIALLRYKVGPIKLLIACAFAGLMVSFYA